jgi:hypothetical protein
MAQPLEAGGGWNTAWATLAAYEGCDKLSEQAAKGDESGFFARSIKLSLACVHDSRKVS